MSGPDDALPQLVGTQKDAQEAIREMVRAGKIKLGQNGGPQAQAMEAFHTNQQLDDVNAGKGGTCAKNINELKQANLATISNSWQQQSNYDDLYKADAALEKTYGKVMNDSDSKLSDPRSKLNDTVEVAANKEALKEYLSSHRLDQAFLKKLQDQISGLPTETAGPTGKETGGQKPVTEVARGGK